MFFFFFAVCNFSYIMQLLIMCEDSSPKCCFTPLPCLSTVNLTSIPADCSEYYMRCCKAVRLWASGEVGAAYCLLAGRTCFFHLLCSPTLLSSRPPTSTAVMNKTTDAGLLRFC